MWNIYNIFLSRVDRVLSHKSCGNETKRVLYAVCVSISFLETRNIEKKQTATLAFSKNDTGYQNGTKKK